MPLYREIKNWLDSRPSRNETAPPIEIFEEFVQADEYIKQLEQKVRPFRPSKKEKIYFRLAGGVLTIAGASALIADLTLLGGGVTLGGLVIWSTTEAIEFLDGAHRANAERLISELEAHKDQLRPHLE